MCFISAYEVNHDAEKNQENTKFRETSPYVPKFHLGWLISYIIECWGTVITNNLVPVPSQDKLGGLQQDGHPV